MTIFLPVSLGSAMKTMPLNSALKTAALNLSPHLYQVAFFKWKLGFVGTFNNRNGNNLSVFPDLGHFNFFTCNFHMYNTLPTHLCYEILCHNQSFVERFNFVSFLTR